MGNTLNFDEYNIAWIAVLPIEAEAALGMLDTQHDGQFETVRGDDYIYIGGEINRHKVVVATLPAGQNYGPGAAAALVNQVKARFPNIWFALLVGVAAGLPNLPQKPSAKSRDIRLGDVLVCIPEKASFGVVHYDLGSDTGEGFLLTGRQAEPPAIVRSAIGNIQLTKKKPFKKGNIFATYLAAFQEKADDSKFSCPGQQEDSLFVGLENEGQPPLLVDREARDESERTRVWYGKIGSGSTLMRNPRRRDELRDKYDLIGLEMEAAGVMNTLPTGVIRGVCDYGDSHKNKDWQPYAAAVAAVFAKGILYTINPKAAKMPAVNGHWLVPFGRNKQFVGRVSELAQIIAKLDPNYVDHCSRVAIAGLGGIGKTQMALEVAFQIQTLHPDCSVFWVPAIDTTTFERAFREIGQKLLIPGIDEDKADVKLLVKTSLSQESAGRWLMVIDNADDIGMPFAEADKGSEINISSRLLDYLPFSRNGSILFTTRDGKAAAKQAEVDVVMLKEMSESDSLQLLKLSLQGPNLLGDTIAAKKLLDVLTHLPLAIKQATAFINENATSISEYLEICESNEDQFIELLSRDFEDKGRYKSTIAVKNPIALTWLISFRQILTRDILAAEYLFFMSCVAQQDIPDSLLPAAPKLKRIEALGTLKAYAFITPHDRQHSYGIHRLVQIAVRNWLKQKSELALWSGRALQQLANVFPFPEHENRDVWSMYFPHAIYVLSLQKFCGDFEKPKSDLLFNVAECFWRTGKYREAEHIYRQTLELREKVLGANHPSTLGSMNNLALMLLDQGKYDEAEKMHRHTLELREKALGIDHPSTLESMDNLALVLRHQGKYDEAEKMHRHTVQLMEKALGIDHPSTLNGMNNLTSVLQEQGKYDKAEKMHRHTLELSDKALGIDHPSTLNSMDNLALVLRHQGKYNEAEKMHRHTLELRKKALGIDHPSTLMSIDNIALVLRHQGKYDEAEKMHRHTLELSDKALGIDHPLTLSSMDNLALVLRYKGKYDEAEKMHRQALELMEKVLGVNHPSTLGSMNNLALVLYNQGKYDEAEKMHRHTLELMEKVLGVDHPSTLRSMNNLALVLRDQDKYDKAEKIHQHTLEAS